MNGKARISKYGAETPAGSFPRKAVPVQGGKTEDETGRNYSAVVTSAELAASRVISGAEHKSGLGDQLDVPTLLETLREQAGKVQRGDLSQAESMLMNQATALQSLLSRLAERGIGCDHAPAFEANMRMALGAQSQCRAALATLAAVKNPPIVYARQANVTTGPQQINNGMAAPAQTGKLKISKPNYWRPNRMNGWTPERRARQAELIRRWKPWERSTGPTTDEGKARVARNADKGGTRRILRQIAAALRAI